MKVKQINLRCFEIALEANEAAEFEAYVTTHEAILRRYLLLLQGAHDQAVENFLRREGFTYAWAEGAPLVAKETTRSEEAPKVRKSAATAAGSVRTLVQKKPVRSGELIEHTGDALFFGRINSGAQLNVSGNCVLFGALFGLCVCEGESAVVHEVGKGGLFIFHGTVYESADFKAGAKRLFWENDHAKFEDLK